MSDYAVFRSKAPWIMSNLVRDFDLSVDQAAAILGNLGHESAGFTAWQERSPRGGRGGWGWAQWTGPRRVEFEKWAQRNGLGLKSDEANYGYLRLELLGSEKGAIAALEKTTSLEEGVKVFEQHFERAAADAKHYPQRERYAQVAVEAYYEVNKGNRSRLDVDFGPAVSAEALSFGMTGLGVRQLQDTLASLNYPVGKMDGIFGDFTRGALLAFQANNDLPTTGAVDNATREALTKGRPRPLTHERLEMTDPDLARLGSTTIVQGNRTKQLGWVAGILGMLGLGTDLLGRGATGSPFPLPLPSSTTANHPPVDSQPIFEKLQQLLSTIGNGRGPKITQAQGYVTELQDIFDTLVVRNALAMDMSFVQGDGSPILSIASRLLPGIPGSLLAVVLGVAAHYLGKQVVNSRLRDHRNGSNIGR